MKWGVKRVARAAALRGDEQARRIAYLERRVRDLEAQNAITDERRRDVHAALAVVVHACGGRVEVNFWHFAEMHPNRYGVDINFDARTNCQVFTTTSSGFRLR